MTNKGWESQIHYTVPTYFVHGFFKFDWIEMSFLLHSCPDVFSTLLFFQKIKSRFYTIPCYFHQENVDLIGCINVGKPKMPCIFICGLQTNNKHYSEMASGLPLSRGCDPVSTSRHRLLLCQTWRWYGVAHGIAFPGQILLGYCRCLGGSSVQSILPWAP